MKKYTDEELRSALNVLNSILDKENSDLNELNREEAQEVLNLIKQNSTNERKSKNKRKKNIIIISSIATSIVAISIAIIFVVNTIIIPKSRYSHALDLIKAEEYNKAYDILENLGDYEDASEQIKKSKYNRAIDLLDSEKYDEAYLLLQELGDYNNSDELIKKSKYDHALKLLEKNDYDTAYTLLNELNNYSDAKDLINESKYARALTHLDKKEYNKCYALLSELGDYSNCKELIDQLFDKSPTFMIKDANVGDTVLFGKFEQSSYYGESAIEWEIISKQKGKALLISKKCLIKSKYNEAKDVDVTWATCSLRKWLNGDFYKTAFNSKEKKHIITSKVKTADNIINKTKGGSATNDKVFILSKEETQKYLTNPDSRKSIGTDITGTVDKWLLRTPGSNQSTTLFINNGIIVGGGTTSNSTDSNYADWLYYHTTKFGVRPVIWVSY